MREKIDREKIEQGYTYDRQIAVWPDQLNGLEDHYEELEKQLYDTQNLIPQFENKLKIAVDIIKTDESMLHGLEYATHYRRKKDFLKSIKE